MIWGAIVEFFAPFTRPLAKKWSNKIDKDNSPSELAKREREKTAVHINKSDSNAESVDVNDILRDIESEREDSSEQQSSDNRQGGTDPNRPA